MTDLTGAIRNDLRRLVRGDLLFDDRSRVAYSTAACMFEIEPIGVVAPRDAADVSAVVAYCRRHAIPITGRGAGSSVAGQAVGRGLILDFSRRMNRIGRVDRRGRTVRVQPGVVLARLNESLRPRGLEFAPDPSSAAFCTLGGMISTNAGGVHSVRYGTTRDRIRSLDVVLDTGEAARFETVGPPRKGTRFGEIVAGTTALLRGFRAAIEAGRPDAPKSSSGYHLYGILRGSRVDMHKLYAGSEGTLAVLTGAVLELSPLPRSRRLGVLRYASCQAACERIEAILRMGPSALELIDETTTDILLDYSPEAGRTLGGRGAYLLVEFDNAPRKVAALRRTARPDGFAAPPPRASGEIWRARRMISPSLERRPGPTRSTRIVEDVCVPPARVGEYVAFLKKLLRCYGFEAAIFGHAGSGNIHANLFVDTRNPNDLERIQVFALETYRAVKRMGGSMSGEHGDGLLRAPYMREFFGDLFPVFEALKNVFDPSGILNPGKKIGPPGYRFITDFRPSRRPPFRPPEDPRLAGVAAHLDACNGCAKCRTYCPVVAARPGELSTPRAKINLLLAASMSRVDLEDLAGDAAFRTDLSVCASCRLCLTECPAGADLPAIAESILRPRSS